MKETKGQNLGAIVYCSPIRIGSFPR